MTDPRPSLRVLFAEDARDFRELVRDALQGRGFAVTAVEDGVRAVEAFRWSTFDVVLTDLAMPGLNGLQVAKACKRHRPGVKVVVLTGWDLLLEDAECIAHGVAECSANFPLDPAGRPGPVAVTSSQRRRSPG